MVHAAEEGRLDEAKAALEHALASSELFGAPLLVIANKQVRRGLMHPLLHARRVDRAALKGTHLQRIPANVYAPCVFRIGTAPCRGPLCQITWGRPPCGRIDPAGENRLCTYAASYKLHLMALQWTLKALHNFIQGAASQRVHRGGHHRGSAVADRGSQAEPARGASAAAGADVGPCDDTLILGQSAGGLKCQS